MCGIVGAFSRTHAPVSVLDVLPILAHRGPDGQGHVVDGPVALGHTRLSIIDLSDQAAQPMRSHDGRFLIVFNGEIYNHLELREELRGYGARFITASDTEVILEAYRVWGKACVLRFRGMFTFALWDTKAQMLFMARDRCGERPFFYCRSGDNFFFASEMKALVSLLPAKPTLNPLAVDMYLHYQYTPEPFTLLEGVHKLPAAHSLTLSVDNWQAAPVRYWDVEACADNWTGSVPTDTAGILAAIRENLEESVLMTLRADVPVAVALSGGIDSGVIATLAQKHYPEPMHAFSVGYPTRPPYDEREQAKALATQLGMIFHEVVLPVDAFVAFFPQLVRIMDEPIADPAAFGHFAVPQAARELGIKVLLSGIGGDELFWGYDWTRQAVVSNEARLRGKGSMYRNLLNLPGMERVVRYFARAHMAPGSVRSLCNRWIEAHAHQPEAGGHALAFYETTADFGYARKNVRALYGEAMHVVPHFNAYTPECLGSRTPEQMPAAIIRLLFDTWLVSNCLTLGDRVSMGVGVEARLPFLDVKLIELVMALRAKTSDHGLGQKGWLRAALKGVLPEEVLTRPKAGFQPPVQAWIAGVLERYGSQCASGSLQSASLVRPEVCSSLNTFSTSDGWNSLFMAYKILLLNLWYDSLEESATIISGQYS